MAKKKREPRLSVRVDQWVYDEIRATAQALQLPVNVLVKSFIVRGLRDIRAQLMRRNDGAKG